MDILPINNNFSYRYPLTDKAKKNNDSLTEAKPVSFDVPFYKPINFTGGISMDLGATKKQLDLYGKYPPGIKEAIEETLENGNPEGKTLIDIHREKYSPLNGCETLKEAKEMFPEFSGVKSDKEVVFVKGGFVSDVKEGKIEGMEPEGDVALQLLQMYWGEGISLSEMQNNLAGRNIRSTFERLQIPLHDRVYSRYLTMSDKEYNSSYSQKIAQRNHETAERKREQGIAYHSPLTDEHKENISKGMKRFYEEHPERVFEVSEQLAKYFEANPEERERLTQVMLRAWNYPEAKPVRKAMARMMRKNAITDDDIKSSVETNFKDRLNFRDFWQRNSWAKERFNVCMNKSWKRQDELTAIGLIYEPAYRAELLPKALKSEIANDTRDEMPYICRYIGCTIADPREKNTDANGILIPKIPEEIKANKIVDDYLHKNPEMSRKSAQAYNLGIVYAKDYLENSKDVKKETLETFKELHRQRRLEERTNNGGQTTPDDSRNIYFDMIFACVLTDDIKSARKVDECVNKAYNKTRYMTPEKFSEFFHSEQIKLKTVKNF